MRISFHEARSGRSYFEKFLDDLNSTDKASILAIFEDIKKYDFQAIGCKFRQIEGKLWEIKIKTSGGGWRFFYVMLSLDHMHILHSYKKQTQKAPHHEIEIAKKRLKEVIP